jgi:hypothetical protein
MLPFALLAMIVFGFVVLNTPHRAHAVPAVPAALNYSTATISPIQPIYPDYSSTWAENTCNVMAQLDFLDEEADCSDFTECCLTVGDNFMEAVQLVKNPVCPLQLWEVILKAEGQVCWGKSHHIPLIVPCS